MKRNISLSCAREGSGIIVALIFFDVSQRRASSRVETVSRFLPLPAFRIHQTAKVSMLIETTFKQLGVLSEMLWLMRKPNKRSKRLKANIVAWTSSAVSVNLSLSELKPNQIQILRSVHECRHRYVHGRARVCSQARRNAIHAGLVLMCCSWVMSWGMWRGRAGPELLRCSFVYPDGFQMLASDRSATERWGSSPTVWGLSQVARIKAALSGILEKNMGLLCNNFTLGDLKYKMLKLLMRTNIVFTAITS